jgi:LDH2 family malate/lactate/ureidoglycolate dehydrogenase
VNRYSSASVMQWASVVLQAGGISAPHAEIASEVLVRTNLRGVDSHGISRIPIYMQRIAAGEITSNDPKAEMRDGTLHVDGKGALGQVVARFAVDQAVQATEKIGCAPCVIVNSGHLSALGLFALQAAENGRVALVCQRTPPVMGLPGSPRANMGNNPIAFAAPVRGGTPLVFDMANSVVARGRIQQAARDNAPIPADWAMDGDGQPTTEAAAALMGYLRPMAEHKGIGLAMMVEVLSAGLAGWREHKDPEATASGSGTSVDAFILLINPALVCGQEAFEDGAHRWLRHFLNTSGSGARFPGQRQAAMEKERRSIGMPIPASVVRELREAGQAVGHDFDLIPLGTATSR